MRTKALIFGLLLAASTHAQLLYHDASAFPLLGKAMDATLTRYLLHIALRKIIIWM